MNTSHTEMEFRESFEGQLYTSTQGQQCRMGKVHSPTEVGFEAAAAAGLEAQSIGTMSKHQIERGSSNEQLILYRVVSTSIAMHSWITP
jgi:hypothetical protein